MITDGAKLSLWPIDGAKYAIHDMNGDGIPELLTSAVIERYEWDAGGVFTTVDHSIFSFHDGAVSVWYGGAGHPFQLLENNMICCEYRSNDLSTTIFLSCSFDTDGNEKIEGDLTQRLNTDQTVEYEINGEIVDRSAWELAKEELDAKIDHSSWIDYTPEEKPFPGCSDSQ